MRDDSCISICANKSFKIAISDISGVSLIKTVLRFSTIFIKLYKSSTVYLFPCRFKDSIFSSNVHKGLYSVGFSPQMALNSSGIGVGLSNLQ